MLPQIEAKCSTFPVGKYTATFTYDLQLGVEVVWKTYLPKRLREEEVAQYREGRDQFIRSLGINTVLVAF